MDSSRNPSEPFGEPVSQFLSTPRCLTVCRPGARIINPLPPGQNTPFVHNFLFVGTVDNSNYLCIPAALAFRASLGGESAIRGYCWQLARDAGSHVASTLGTEVMENSTRTLGNCCMSNVKLPISLEQVKSLYPRVAAHDIGTVVRDWLTLRMVNEYNTFMALIFYDNAWWVRLSAQIYLEISDFELAAKVLKELCNRVLAGEFLPPPTPKL
jgi:hercynylcysteine S-oxide lyase